MKRISVLFFILSLLSSDCKKEDPFFKSLPNEFVYERIENISSARLFTDGKEIYDDEIISNIVEKIDVFQSSIRIENAYIDDTFTFVNNSLIKCTGHWVSDSLFYIKKGRTIFAKTEAIWFIGNAFNLVSPFYDIFTWGIDSIDYIIPGFGPPISVYAHNLEYAISNAEMHIPVLGYYYKKEYFSINGYREGVFNKDVISELTSDTCAIIEYNIIFSELIF